MLKAIIKTLSVVVQWKTYCPWHHRTSHVELVLVTAATEASHAPDRVLAEHCVGRHFFLTPSVRIDDHIPIDWFYPVCMCSGQPATL